MCRRLWLRQPVQTHRFFLEGVEGHVTTSDNSENFQRPHGLQGGAMIRRTFAQRSVFEVLLPDGDKLGDPTLQRFDAILLA